MKLRLLAGRPRWAWRRLPALAAGKRLHVYNWSDYIAEDTVAKFEEETGIKVVYDVYDFERGAGGQAPRRQLRLRHRGAELELPPAPDRRPDVYLPLDKSKLPNLKNMDPGLMEDGGRPTIPTTSTPSIYMWGTDRHRLQRRQGQGAPRRGRAGRQLVAGLRPGVCRQARRLRHHHARLARPTCCSRRSPTSGSIR